MHKINWIKPGLPKEISTYCVRNNFKASLSIIFYFVILGTTGFLSYYFFNNESFFIFFIFLYLHCTFYSFLGWSGIGHELIHNNVFTNNFTNKLFLKLFSFLTWSNYVYFEESHKRHHLFTLYTKLDQEVIIPVSISSKDWFYLFTFNFPSFFNTIKAIIENSVGKINGTWGNELFSKNDKKKERLFNVARIILIGHLLSIIFFLLNGHYEFIFIITLAPFIANWLNRIMGISQHIGMSANYNDFRLNSTTIRLNLFLSMLYSNMNYHIEHHLYPAVPFYNLPLLSKDIKEFLPQPIIGFLNVVNYVRSKGRQNNDTR